MAGRTEYETLFKIGAQLSSTFSKSFQSAQGELSLTQSKIMELNKAQSDISAYQKQQQAFAANQRKLEELRTQYAELQRVEELYKNSYVESTSEIGESTQDFTTKYRKLEEQIYKTAIDIQDNKEKMDGLDGALKKSGISTERLAAESQMLSAEYAKLQNNQTGVIASGNNFSSSLKQLAIGAAGVAISAKTLQSLSGYIKNAAGAAIEFETAITGVNRRVQGTPAELAAINKGIRDMSILIPSSAAEIAKVAENAGQLGIATKDVLNFSEIMIKIGTTTGMSAEAASASLAKFANITQMSAADYERLGSTILALGNKSATTESEIVNMATSIASAGTLVGVSEANIMAIATALSSLGIESQAGGSAVSRLLRSFETMVATGSDKLESFAATAGMSADDFRKAWGKNAVGTLSAFNDGLGKIDKAGGSSIATLNKLGINDTRMTDAILRITTSGGMLTDMVELSNSAWEKNTAISEAASMQYDITESKLKLLENAATNLKITLGGYLTPAIDAGAEALAGFFNSVNTWLQGGETLNERMLEIQGSFQSAGEVSDLFARYYELQDAMSDTSLSAEELSEVEAQLTETKIKLANASGGVIAGAEFEIETFEKLVDTIADVNEWILLEERGNYLAGITEGALDFENALIRIAYAAIMERVNAELITTNEVVEDVAPMLLTSAEEVNESLVPLIERAEKLGAEYEASYNSAYNSMSGQIGLFNDMRKAMDEVKGLTAIEITSNLQSQIAYMQEYTANLQKASDLGLSAEAITAFSDGSTQSMANLSELVKSDEQTIKDINALFSAKQQELDKYSSVVAKLENSFPENMEALQLELETKVSEMNLSDEAALSGKNTILGFIEGAEKLLPEVDAAYSKIASAAIRAINNSLTGQGVTAETFVQPSYNEMHAYASGTMSAAPGLALVGENGPELVSFGGGEVVYTSADTRRMLGEYSGAGAVPMAGSVLNAEQTPASREITLNIKIDVTGDAPDGIREQLMDYADDLAELVLDKLDDLQYDYRRTHL